MQPWDTPEKLDKYLETHQDIWDNFVQYSNELRDSGCTISSSQLIVNRIRWERQLGSTVLEPFKISMNLSPYLARKLAREQPEKFGNFFRYRKLKENNELWDVPLSPTPGCETEDDDE